MQTHTIVHGRHTKRTAAFVKACMAFCFITIPSINSLMLRLNLHLLCAQAASIPPRPHPHPTPPSCRPSPSPSPSPISTPPTLLPSHPQLRPRAAQPAPLRAQAALCNQLLPQMEGFVKAVVTLVPEVLAPAGQELEGALKAEAEKREEVLVALLSNLCSFLVVVPGHPEHGPFYLVTGLLNVLQVATLA